MKQYLRISEALRKLGVHRNTLLRWEQQGRITAYRGPGRVRFYRKLDIERLVRERLPRLNGGAGGCPEPAGSQTKTVGGDGRQRKEAGSRSGLTGKQRQ